MFALFAGYQLLSITSPGTLSTNACALGTTLGYGNPALFGQCTLAPDTTYLSVYVDAYCGGERRVLSLMKSEDAEYPVAA